MTNALKELGAHIEIKRPDCVLSWEVVNDELTLTVSASNLVSFVEFLKVDGTCQFSSLVDITAVDYPSRAKRFGVVSAVFDRLLQCSMHRRCQTETFNRDRLPFLESSQKVFR